MLTAHQRKYIKDLENCLEVITKHFAYIQLPEEKIPNLGTGFTASQVLGTQRQTFTFRKSESEKDDRLVHTVKALAARNPDDPSPLVRLAMAVDKLKLSASLEPAIGITKSVIKVPSLYVIVSFDGEGGAMQYLHNMNVNEMLVVKEWLINTKAAIENRQHMANVIIYNVDCIITTTTDFNLNWQYN